MASGSSTLPQDVLNELKNVPNIIKDGLKKVGGDESWLTFRYTLTRGFVILLPEQPPTQIRGSIKIGDAKIFEMPKAWTYVRLDDRRVRVEYGYIQGTTIYGRMKTSVVDVMYSVMKRCKLEALAKIYRANDPLASLAVSIFRMSPLICPLKKHPRELIEAVWSNFIWTAWGLGIERSAFPQCKFKMMAARPIYVEMKHLYMQYERAVKRLEKLLPEPFVEVLHSFEPGSIRSLIEQQRSAITKETHRRTDLRRYYEELGIDSTEVARVPVKSKDEGSDLTRSIIWSIEVYGDLVPFFSPAYHAQTRALFSRAEIMTLAVALEQLDSVSTSHNVFDIFAYFEFVDPETKNRIELVKATLPSLVFDEEERQFANEQLRMEAERFRKWVEAIDYSEIVLPVAKAILHLKKE